MINFTAEQLIEAAKKRLGDLKALHTRYVNTRIERSPDAVLDEMEQIAFSFGCILMANRGSIFANTRQRVQ